MVGGRVSGDMLCSSCFFKSSERSAAPLLAWNGSTSLECFVVYVRCLGRWIIRQGSAFIVLGVSGLVRRRARHYEEVQKNQAPPTPIVAKAVQYLLH